MTRGLPPTTFEVPIMDKTEQRLLVVKTLSMYSKKLTDMQLDLLLQNPAATSPLFLRVCVDELRLQADYGMDGNGVANMIQSFPVTVQEELEYQLKRVESDMTEWLEGSGAPLPDISNAQIVSEGQPPRSTRSARSSAVSASLSFGALMVRDCLSLLVLSRRGLYESEMQAILAPRGLPQLPRSEWIRYVTMRSMCVRVCQTMLCVLTQIKQGYVGHLISTFVSAVTHLMG